MKILSRLRDLLTQPQGEVPTEVPVAPLLNRDEMDFDDCYDESSEGDLQGVGTSSGVMNGLRRRIPDLHEDVPPVAFGMDTQQDDSP